MIVANSSSAVLADPVPADRILKVVLAYEDAEAVRRAQRACFTLARMGHVQIRVPMETWQFDLLQVAAMLFLAAQAAQGCDLVVLAPQNPGRLPDTVQLWIRSMLKAVAPPLGLLVLQRPGPEPGKWRRHSEIPEHPLTGLDSAMRFPCWNLEADPPVRAWLEPEYPPHALAAVMRTVLGAKEPGPSSGGAEASALDGGTPGDDHGGPGSE